MEKTGFATWEKDMPEVASFFSRSPQTLPDHWDNHQLAHRPLCASCLCYMRHLSTGSHERDTLGGRAEEVSQTNLLSRAWNLTRLSVFCKYFLTWKLLQPDLKPQGQEEGQGGLTGSPDITCPQPVHSVLGRSWNQCRQCSQAWQVLPGLSDDTGYTATVTDNLPATALSWWW